MLVEKYILDQHNDAHLQEHIRNYEFLAENLERKGLHVSTLVKKLQQLQVTIPTWVLGTGGTRFGRFGGGGEPRTLTEKMEDVALLNSLSRSCNAVSLHLPRDTPEDLDGILHLAKELDLQFAAVNSNTFQDQPGQPLSYKYGSLSHPDVEVRNQAIAHNLDVIRLGQGLGTKALSIWLPDGSSFPGQTDFRKSFQHTLESLQHLYAALPADWTITIEYKPFEPMFYSSVIPDWGTAFLICAQLGAKAKCLVDTGHHLPNTNIEQIVAMLLHGQKLGGLHFNDSKYADDDVTVGSLNPYQLFLIFLELVKEESARKKFSLNLMIDASHNIKDPLEDLLQSLEAIRLAYAQALLVDKEALAEAQRDCDATRAQEVLQAAFRTDVRPLLAEARLLSSAAISPLELYRQQNFREELVKERGKPSFVL